MKKKALVSHSGGMDSSICLRLAIQKFGSENVLSVGFDYGQRHREEMEAAQKICRDWNVQRVVLDLNCLSKITTDSLTCHQMNVTEGNTLVVGRNGLMAKLSAIHAHDLGAELVYLGVMGVEGAHAGYRDCSRQYIDLVENVVRHDLDNPNFAFVTPLVDLTKAESLQIAKDLGILEYLWVNTVTCYLGIKGTGCKKCPGCRVRNDGIAEFKLSIRSRN